MIEVGKHEASGWVILVDMCAHGTETKFQSFWSAAQEMGKQTF